MEPVAPGYANFLTIGCRFVPNDQWFVTHINASWKIEDIKKWLLAKCLPSLFSPVPDFPRPQSLQRRRPVSPITFASRGRVDDRSPPDDLEYLQEGADYYEDTDEHADGFFQEKYKYTPGRLSESTSNLELVPKSSLITHSQYVLLAFSTGQILEDHYTLEWYALHPHELLELHSSASVVKLSRGLVEEYVQPYFESRVWALRMISREDDSGVPIPKVAGKAIEGDDERDKFAKKRRTKLHWQDRLVVIHQGVLHLCRARNDGTTLHSAPLSSLVSLRGAEYLRQIRGPSSSLSFSSPPSSHAASPYPGNSPVTAEKRIVCAKFRTDGRSTESTGGSWWRRGSRDAGGSEESRKNSVAGIEAGCVEDETECLTDGRGDSNIMIVMDMQDDHAYENILRILHRNSPSIPSTFFPVSSRMRSPRRRSFSPISFASGSPISSSPATPVSFQRSPSPLDRYRDKPRSVRYPEWRTELVRKARRAGLGDVGCAMEWAMFGSTADQQAEGKDSDNDETLDLVDDFEERGRGRTKVWGVELKSLSESINSDASVSEREWESWEGDLVSQRTRWKQSEFADLTSNWNSLVGSPSADYSFPPVNAQSAENDSPFSVPQHTLSSYSSADSLLRRTIKRASPRKHGSITTRSGSPAFRTRPRSPLAAYLDGMEGETDSSSFTSIGHRQFYSDIAYPSRQASAESGQSSLSSRTILHPVPRAPLPMSMAMTTITSTVTAGAGTPTKEKGKGRDKFKENKPRRRSSTIHSGPSSPTKPPLSGHIKDGEDIHATRMSPGNLETPPDSPGQDTDQSSKGDSSERKFLKPGKLKLSLSFAQVAASSTGTTSASRLPSATSTSSFESPRFAHPDSSVSD